MCPTRIELFWFISVEMGSSNQSCTQISVDVGGLFVCNGLWMEFTKKISQKMCVEGGMWTVIAHNLDQVPGQ